MMMLTVNDDDDRGVIGLEALVMLTVNDVDRGV